MSQSVDDRLSAGSSGSDAGSRRLVAGIDSSTQSCKVLICDAVTGEVVRQGNASHPDGTEVDPEHWWTALQTAIEAAGGLHDVSAVSVGGQQHGMVALDADGRVIRPALLWNDTRSAPAAAQLIADLAGPDGTGGEAAWAQAVGSVPVASFTLTKLRWLADHEPENAARVAAVCLPHDWLTWRLSGSASIGDLVTDRSDASGTGYFDSVSNEYRRDLLALGLRRETADDVVVPRVLGPHEVAGRLYDSSTVLGPGCGDNAGAALGLGLAPGQTSVSLGTSGVVAAVSSTPTHDETGLVAGFADGTGHWLPLAATLNGSRVLDATARLLGVDHAGLSQLALAAEPGAGGLVELCLLEGERTPNLPDATGTLHGMKLASMTRENLARAAVEGLLCLMAYGLDAMRALGVAVDEVTLTGGGAKSVAVQQVAPSVLGVPVSLPPSGEYVARGAARQAAWVLAGGEAPPDWPVTGTTVSTGDDHGWVRDRWTSALTALTALTGKAD